MKLICSTVKGTQNTKVNDKSLKECDLTNDKHTDSVLSYDQKQFLKIALEGNDFSDSTISANTNTDFNILNYSDATKQYHITVSSTNNSNVPVQDAVSSIETMDASKLISYTESRTSKKLGLFQSMLKKTRESFRFKKTIDKTLTNDELTNSSQCASNFTGNSSCNDSLVEELLCEMSKRKQLLKARKQCFLKRKFQDTTQQVEVERQLLYSDARIKNLQTCISSIDFEERNGTTALQSRGYLHLTDIIVPVRVINDKDYSEYYVCVLSYDQHVFVTDYIKVVDNKFAFNDANICFNNIDSNFEIKIVFYALKLKKSIRNYSHESRFNLKRDSTCPTPNVFSTPARSFLKSSKNYSGSKIKEDYEKSNFEYQGSLALNLKNISLFGSYILADLPSSSNIEGVVDISLSARVRLLQECTGFLTIGNEIGGCAFWNRKWCKLDGFLFNYWNYPEDEDTKVPCGSIDFRYCITGEVKPACRQICSRNFTLLIETKQSCKSRDRNSFTCNATHCIQRNLLAADSRADLIKWQHVFNDVLFTLRQWNSLIPNPLHEINEYMI